MRSAKDPMMLTAVEHGLGVNSSYLREQAQRCVRMARDCPHVPTAHQLEAIGMELMEKAREVDDLLSDRRES